MNTEPPLVPEISPARPKSSALAIWSLVLGILSLTCFWLLSAIPAVICGHMAYSRIRRSGGALEGSGLALAGLITGYLSIALSLLFIPLMLAIAFPNFVKARHAAQTNFCINNLRMIDTAKQDWASEHKKSPGDTPSPQDLAPYLQRGFGSLVCPAGGTYSINPVDQNPTCSVPDHQL
jgi:hypothetical protein